MSDASEARRMQLLGDLINLMGRGFLYDCDGDYFASPDSHTKVVTTKGRKFYKKYCEQAKTEVLK